MHLLLAIFLLFFASSIQAQVSPPPLNFEELDGSPSTYPYKMLVTNGTLTDNGDGTATLSIGGGVGVGDVEAVGDCGSGECFNGTQGTTLTFNNAGGDGTLDYDGTDFAFSHPVTVTGLLTTSVGLDAVGGVDMDYGSADVTDHTFVTDGTGDAEIVLPNDSIGDAEVDWGSGAGQIDLADIPGGTAGANTFNFESATTSVATASANDNDTSAASTAFVQQEINGAGGRSLTCSSGSCDANDETYQWKGGYGAFDPVATDDIAQVDYAKKACTMTEFRCYSDQTVVVQLQRDDGSAANMFTADVTCDSGGGSACASGCDTTLVDAEDNVAATNKINLVTVSVSGTPTKVTMQWFGTYDD